jgi:uncharacterized protein YndB with AHSA1/START domain
MHEIPTANHILVLQGDFEAFTPQELYDYFLTPSLVTQWWPDEAQISPCVGGKYCFTWPSMGWTLQGEYKEIEPGERISFSWKWNHDPVDYPTLEVALDFAPAINGGALLTITQGQYDESTAQQEDRAGHREGWIHFCMKLAGLREGKQDTELTGGE